MRLWGYMHCIWLTTRQTVVTVESIGSPLRRSILDSWRFCYDECSSAIDVWFATRDRACTAHACWRHPWRPICRPLSAPDRTGDTPLETADRSNVISAATDNRLSEIGPVRSSAVQDVAVICASMFVHSIVRLCVAFDRNLADIRRRDRRWGNVLWKSIGLRRTAINAKNWNAIT